MCTETYTDQLFIHCSHCRCQALAHHLERKRYSLSNTHTKVDLIGPTRDNKVWMGIVQQSHGILLCLVLVVRSSIWPYILMINSKQRLIVSISFCYPTFPTHNNKFLNDPTSTNFDRLEDPRLNNTTFIQLEDPTTSNDTISNMTRGPNSRDI